MKKGAPWKNDYEYSASSGMRRPRRKLLLALMGGSMSLQPFHFISWNLKSNSSVGTHRAEICTVLKEKAEVGDVVGEERGESGGDMGERGAGA